MLNIQNPILFYEDLRLFDNKYLNLDNRYSKQNKVENSWFKSKLGGIFSVFLK